MGASSLVLCVGGGWNPRRPAQSSGLGSINSKYSEMYEHSERAGLSRYAFQAEEAASAKALRQDSVWLAINICCE